MRHFQITFFQLRTSFLEWDINEKFWKKFQMFLYIASINGTNFKYFHWFFNERENNNEVAGIPDFKLEYLAHTNWSKKSASGFLFCEDINKRISWWRFGDGPLFFFVTLCKAKEVRLRTTENLFSGDFSQNIIHFEEKSFEQKLF